MNPCWLTGFVDGEGCFWVSISKDQTFKTGWKVRLFFEIHLHEKDLALLKRIQKFFGVGRVYMKNDNSITYLVTSVKDLQVIRQHLEKYPLITKKCADFLLWTQIFSLIQNRKHLTVEGLNKIVAIKASINLGLSYTPSGNKLKAAFPYIVPVQRPQGVPSDSRIKYPNWLAGFVCGEGCFFIELYKDENIKLKDSVRLMFLLGQHSRDEQLIKSLVEYFNCGSINKKSRAFEFKVTKFSDIMYKIIPFFKKYPIEGVKQKDFNDFCKVADLVKDKKHLTKEGLEHIYQIKIQMNKKRSVY